MNKQEIVKLLYTAYGTDSGILFGIKEKSIVENIVDFTLARAESQSSDKDKDKLIDILDKIIKQQWEFIEDVKKGQQGELKAAFIHRIIQKANKLLVDKK